MFTPEAIDFHTHVMQSVDGAAVEQNEAEAAVMALFKSTDLLTLPQMVEHYRKRNMAFVTFTVDDVHRTGVEPSVGNEEIARLAAEPEHRDVVIPFASIDPHRGAAGVREARRLVEEMGVRGFKLHPSQQAFQPDERQWYPLYEAFAELGVPALFHSGQTAVGRGQPGGGGIKLAYSNPMMLDAVAADLPDLTIVIAHPSFPWQEEAISVALHKPNVYIDLSGWAPKYFPAVLLQYVRTQLQDKVLFGSDFPAISPERWVREWADHQMPDEVTQKVMLDNARRVLAIND